MTDDQSRRPDPSLNPDEAAEQQPTEELPADAQPVDDAPLSPDAPPVGEPEPEPAPAPTRAPAAPGRAARPTSPKGNRDVGYRGSLPPRNDHIARPWVITVIGLFVLILVLSLAGLPSRLFPEPTPAPIPSFSLEPIPSRSVAASPQ